MAVRITPFIPAATKVFTHCSQSSFAGRTVGTDIYLVGVDALSEALESVIAGTMTGTVFNDHFSQSHSAADAAINYLTGAENEHYIGCDYVKVTQDNAQEVLDMVK